MYNRYGNADRFSGVRNARLLFGGSNRALAFYTAHRLNLQYNPTADRQPGIFPETSL